MCFFVGRLLGLELGYRAHHYVAEAAPQELLDGSARIALRTEPKFDTCIFIERDPDRYAELEN